MESGEMDERSHVALTDAIHVMQNQEYWQLNNQERHEGKNASTDKQIAISKIALPALERAVQALRADDYSGVLISLELAVNTDGEATPSRRKKS